MSEEEAFWVTCCVAEDIIPAITDQKSPLFGMAPLLETFQGMLDACVPGLTARLTELHVAIDHFVMDWWITLFTCVFDERSVIWVWDAIFDQEKHILLRISLALLRFVPCGLMQRVLGCMHSWSSSGTCAAISRVQSMCWSP